MPQIETVLKAQDPDRQHDRGAVVSGRQEPRAGEEDRRAREEGQGRRARHRRQSRLRDGRAADHADRRLRARRQHPRSIASRTRASAACRSSRRSARASPPSSSRRRSRIGSVRHVGLAESVTMIADAFGWKLDKVTDEIQPKIADKSRRERAHRRRSRLRLRHHPGRHRLEERQADDHAPHGGVPRRARRATTRW